MRCWRKNLFPPGRFLHYTMAWLGERKTIRDTTMEMCIIRNKLTHWKWKILPLLVNEVFSWINFSRLLGSESWKSDDAWPFSSALMLLICIEILRRWCNFWSLKLSIFQRTLALLHSLASFPTKPFCPNLFRSFTTQAHNIIYQSKAKISLSSDRHENWWEKNQALVGRYRRRKREKHRSVNAIQNKKKMKTRSR